ncbi:Chromosome condensation complex Condensin, subunit G [Ceraceosorus bombacis]|uniref:Chromosome condensation complex Condensin, subunit G n=1 Tax=Ceraceosorus bombacis TaxID=401625 RepID=A0A0N7L9B9_9BASI|nr:Chromosome condensation complex Condensin, subunit G [Ceraceosorus bombacis]
MPSAVSAGGNSAARATTLEGLKLSSAVATTFQDTQFTLSTHRKNTVSLFKLHQAAAKFTEATPRGTKLVGEKAFNEAFLACLNRCLDIKKGVVNADRSIKFVAAYSAYAQQQFRAAARVMAGQDAQAPPPDEEEEEDTAGTRFAVVALAKLQGGEDDAEGPQADHPEGSDEESRGDITGVLLKVLRHDPSAEARRAALFNLTPTARTLPYILERLRDVDAINRRCVYSGSLSHNMLNQPGATAPNVPEWAEVIKVGLGEREESVKRAARRLITSWADRDADLEPFIARFDIIAAPDVAASALQALFEARPALLDTVTFGDGFWQNLTPGTAFIGRYYVEHCRTLGQAGEARLEETMPVTTALAFRTQAAWGSLLELLESESEAAEDRGDILLEKDMSVRARGIQSIVNSMLHIAMSADYGDEIGRRKMFGLVRNMISTSLFPTSLIESALDVLFKLSAGQKDFMQIVVELVQEMGEWEKEGERNKTDEDTEESEVESELTPVRRGGASRKTRSKSPDEAEKAKQATVDMRRLVIVRGMLERISSGGIQEMMGLVSQLVTPAMRSHDELVRENGFLCMGLCSVLDADVAATTFPMFLNHVQKSAGVIKLRAMQIIFDMLLVHGIERLSRAQVEALGGGSAAQAKAHEHLVTFLLGLLEDEDADDEEALRIQAAVTQGVAKLMLAGVIEDDVALKSLILIYMTPETAANQELRQCLGYFLPAYCFSSSRHQHKLRRVLVDTFHILAELYYEQEESSEMVSPLQVGLQLIDWSDPLKNIGESPDPTRYADAAAAAAALDMDHLIAESASSPADDSTDPDQTTTESVPKSSARTAIAPALLELCHWFGQAGLVELRGLNPGPVGEGAVPEAPAAASKGRKKASTGGSTLKEKSNSPAVSSKPKARAKTAASSKSAAKTKPRTKTAESESDSDDEENVGGDDDEDEDQADDYGDEEY